MNHRPSPVRFIGLRQDQPPVLTDGWALTPAELRMLQGLRLSPRRSFTGRVRGERLTRQKGVSIEFADYREYAAGDDLRHLDWNILARLDRAAIRTYQDEEDLAVYVALDVSRSMDFGEPSKFQHAARLAAAVGFIALAGQDAVYPVALGAGEPIPGRPWRGRGNVHALSDWLASREPDGTRGLAASIQRFASGSARPGLFALFSDGLDRDAPDALRALAARGHEVIFVQTLSDIELDPDLEGDLRLLDAETGEAVEITAHAQALSEYKQNITAHCRRLEETTLRYGGRYIRSIVGQSLPDFVTQGLRRNGVTR